MNKLTSIIVALAVVLGTISCGKDDPKQKRPDVMTQMTIHVKANPALKALRADDATEETITVDECMRRTNTMLSIPKGRDNQAVFAITEDIKDYATNSIKMRAITIIDEQGNIGDELGTAKDFVLVEQSIRGVDTVGYIPNRVVHEAFAEAKRLHKEERYEDMVKVFTSVFVAHPCTAKQYEALKAKGLN